MTTNYKRFFFPLNPGLNHWAFVRVEIKDREIYYHDSYAHQGKAKDFLNNIQAFMQAMLKEEALLAKRPYVEGINTVIYKFSEKFKLIDDEKYPRQDNPYDCGVFMLKGIDFLSRNQKLSFTSKDIQYFRTLITVEVINGKLMTPSNFSKLSAH